MTGDTLGVTLLSARSAISAASHCSRKLRLKRLLDRSTEGRRVDRRKSIKLRLDPCEVFQRAPPVDQAAREHLAHIPLVLPMAPLHLRQRLSVEIEMEERDPADLGDESSVLVSREGAHRPRDASRSPHRSSFSANL
jgi:hypothetical protein